MIPILVFSILSLCSASLILAACNAASEADENSEVELH